MDYQSQYRSKLKTPEEAAALVKSGDWIDYATGTNFPALCDAALAKRRDELRGVKIRGMLIYGPVQAVECDPGMDHFVYSTWHCSGYERKLCDRGLCFYEPMIFRNRDWYYKNFLKVNVAFITAAPMDRHGYFNFGVGAGVAKGPLEAADLIVIEVNENMPRVYGYDTSIHISDVDCVVEGEHGPIVSIAAKSPAPADIKIAENVIPYLQDGCTLQLGIGGVPDALGQMIAQSDLKDLGMHTEFCTDAFLALHNAGKLTNKKKSVDRGMCVYGMATGTQALYDWMAENPSVLAYPIAHVNAPEVIARLDNFISLNSCVSIDLYGQICSESAGTRQISGTGGQVDFLTGAAMSRGGKSFICTASTYTDKCGELKSRIVPTFNGDIVTSPRSQAFYIATENAVVNLAGRSAWERADLLISAAAPRFREELIQAAEKQGIWVSSNKR